MAFDYMHPPEDFEYLGEWCKAWRDPATGDWTISQLLDGLAAALTRYGEYRILPCFGWMILIVRDHKNEKHDEKRN